MATPSLDESPVSAKMRSQPKIGISCALVAQWSEQPPCKRPVNGSNPFEGLGRHAARAGQTRPRSSMDRAPDFESVGWGFESLRGRLYFRKTLLFWPRGAFLLVLSLHPIGRFDQNREPAHPPLNNQPRSQMARLVCYKEGGSPARRTGSRSAGRPDLGALAPQLKTKN